MAVGVGVSCDELATVLWGCPFPSQPGMSAGTKSEVEIPTGRSRVFCGPGPRGLSCAHCFIYRRKVIEKRNTSG